MQTMVRTYRDPTSYQAELTRAAALGWAVAGTTEHTPRSGCLRIFALGFIGALVFRPKPQLVVTYQRQLRGDLSDNEALTAFALPQPTAKPPSAAGRWAIAILIWFVSFGILYEVIGAIFVALMGSGGHTVGALLGLILALWPAVTYYEHTAPTQNMTADGPQGSPPDATQTQ